MGFFISGIRYLTLILLRQTFIRLYNYYAMKQTVTEPKGDPEYMMNWVKMSMSSLVPVF